MSTEKLELDSEAAGRRGVRTAGVGTYGWAARLSAEAAGAFLLVLAGVGSGIFASQGGVNANMAFGLALFAGIVAFGYVSGGHFNPAVTLGAALAGRTSWKNVIPYIVVQVIGSTLATLVVWIIINAHPQIAGKTQQFFATIANGFGSSTQNQFELPSVLVAEVVATGIFVAVVLGSTGRKANRALAPFAIGLSFAVLLAVLGPLTNGSMNPARSTAAALFAGGEPLGQLWLFWLAPLLGAALAGLIYRTIDLSENTGARTEYGTGVLEEGTAPVPAGERNLPVVLLHGSTLPNTQAEEPEPRDRATAAQAEHDADLELGESELHGTRLPGSGEPESGLSEAPLPPLKGGDDARDFFDKGPGRP